MQPFWGIGVGGRSVLRAPPKRVEVACLISTMVRSTPKELGSPPRGYRCSRVKSRTSIKMRANARSTVELQVQGDRTWMNDPGDPRCYLP